MKRLIRNLCILLALCILSLLSTAPVFAHANAGGNGSISGRLLDGSNKNASVVGQSVTLQMAQGTSARDLATAKTDGQGTFTFTNLATDKSISYALYIRYQGAQYSSNTLNLASQPNQHQDLTVYEATQDSSKVAVLSTNLLVRDPDTHNGTFTVSAVYAFKNLDTHAYVGSLDGSKGRPNALLFPLPQGAKNIKLGSEFDGYNVIQVDKGFAANAALPPGNSQFSFSFDVPYSGSVYNYSYAPLYPTVSLSFLIPPDIHVSPQGLNAQGLVTGEDQHQYQSFNATVLRPQQSVQFSMEGLTSPATPAPSTPLNLGNLWLVIGLLIMIAILLGTAVISRMMQRGGRRKYAGSHGSSGHGKKHVASSGKSKKDELMHELLQLDKAYEAGKISKSTYNERRGRLKARLRTVMNEREGSRR